MTAEGVGTMLLMLGGPGSAILAGDRINQLGVALAFGISLLVAAYAVGPISGCHINPAVTAGMALMRKVELRLVPAYIAGQLIGAAAGGLIILGIAHGVDGFSASDSGFATNGWGDRSPGGYNFGAMLLVELVFTAVLMFAVLSTTSRKFTASQGGLVVGLTLTLIHLVTIPVDNTSVNPARSFGAVLWSGNGDAWKQIWAFIVFPIVGAALGAFVWLAVDDTRLEDTMFDTKALREVRDQATRVTERVIVETVDKAGERLAASDES
jgi:aquaporin Z